MSVLVAGRSLGCAGDDAIARRKGGRSPFLLPSSALAPPHPPPPHTSLFRFPSMVAPKRPLQREEVGEGK